MPKYGYEFDPFKEVGVEVPRARRAEALEAVAEIVEEEARQFIGEGRSPVEGGKWKRELTPKYKERKGQASSVGYANLEFEGDLLDDLKAEPINTRRIFYGVSSDQADKAEGNNEGTYGGKGDGSRARNFIPIGGQRFKASIRKKIKETLEEFAAEED